MSSRFHISHGAIALVVLASASFSVGASERPELHSQLPTADVSALIFGDVESFAIPRDLNLERKARTTSKVDLYVSDTIPVTPTFDGTAYSTIFKNLALGAGVTSFSAVDQQSAQSATLEDMREAVRLPPSFEVSAATGYGLPESVDRESRVVKRPPPPVLAWTDLLDDGYGSRPAEFLASYQHLR